MLMRVFSFFIAFIFNVAKISTFIFMVVIMHPTKKKFLLEIHWFILFFYIFGCLHRCTLAHWEVTLHFLIPPYQIIVSCLEDSAAFAKPYDLMV